MTIISEEEYDHISTEFDCEAEFALTDDEATDEFDRTDRHYKWMLEAFEHYWKYQNNK